MPKIRSVAKKLFERMTGRQGLERNHKIVDVVIGGANAGPSAELLQDVNTGASVRRIHHQMHGPFRFQHTAQGVEANRGIGQMVQDSRTDNLVESGCQLRDSLNRQLVDLKIRKLIFSLQLLSVAYTGRAEIDTRHLGRRPAHRVFGSLRCPASRDQDGLVFTVGTEGPEQMIVRAPSTVILPKLAILIKIVDRTRVGVTIVKVFDLAGRAV